MLVLRKSPDHLFVYSVAVVPFRQGSGLGKALLGLADERAIEAGLPEVRLYTNRRMERNVRLYRRCGFVEVRKRPHPSRPGEVLVDMMKPTVGAPGGKANPGMIDRGGISTELGDRWLQAWNYLEERGRM